MKEVNADEVSDMTLIHTTWVRSAGRGTVNVPSTDEAHEVKKWLFALGDRLTDMENLHYKGKYPEAHNYPEPVHNVPKHTCGECRLSWQHDAVFEIHCWEGMPPLDNAPEWHLRDEEACSNFKAKKGAE